MKIISTILISLFFNSAKLQGQSVDTNDSQYRLIKLGSDKQATWYSKAAYFKLLKDKKHFFDVTFNEPLISFRNIQAMNYSVLPQSIRYKSQTNRAIKELDMKKAKNFLTKLSSFHTRYYNSTTGAQAAVFIKDYINDIVKKYKYQNGVEVVEIKHDNYNQPDLIVRFKGVKNPSEIIILGSHIDSINNDDPENGRSPGADDDGSGVTVSLEVLRSLVNTNFQPRKTLEFQFYSAEEVGFLGSQYIARSYRNERKRVIGMLHLDMAGYATKESRLIRIVRDYTDPELNKFVELIIKTYTNSSIGDDECGYACSDHASFTEVGYRSAYIFESVFSPVYHSANDTIEYVDFDYLKEMSKVATGFAVELSEPKI
jgi:leucyl aminopeptidase